MRRTKWNGAKHNVTIFPIREEQVIFEKQTKLECNISIETQQDSIINLLMVTNANKWTKSHNTVGLKAAKVQQ